MSATSINGRWRGRLPDGKMLIPGVVSHATNIVEHPQVVADRIVPMQKQSDGKTSSQVQIAGSRARIHPQLAWAKLEALAAGAKLASPELWR